MLLYPYVTGTLLIPDPYVTWTLMIPDPYVTWTLMIPDPYVTWTPTMRLHVGWNDFHVSWDAFSRRLKRVFTSHEMMPPSTVNYVAMMPTLTW